MNFLLKNRVLWSYDHEVEQRNAIDNIGVHFSGVGPFHAHEGEIILTETNILISGDESIEIELNGIDQLYLGFDDIFPRTLVKNFGLFWQPLRISFYRSGLSNSIYLIIGLNMFSCENQLWFNTLKELLS